MRESYPQLIETLGFVARDIFGLGAIRSFIVEDGEDADGDAVLNVTAVFSDPEKSKDTKSLLYFTLRARDELEATGENRFPVFTFVLADEYDRVAAA